MPCWQDFGEKKEKTPQSGVLITGHNSIRASCLNLILRPCNYILVDNLMSSNLTIDNKIRERSIKNYYPLIQTVLLNQNLPTR